MQLRVCRRLVVWAAIAGGLVACQDDKITVPNTPPELVGQATLPIFPSLQQTQVWCWAASAEMVLRYYGLPNLNIGGNYQCGIVAAWFGTQGFPACLSNCGFCQFPVGPMTNEYQVVTGYGPFVRSLGINSRVLTATLVFRYLSDQEIKVEIDAGRPIIIGISPGSAFALPNASQHIAVLVGYDFTPTSEEVIVNDPFPFDFFPFNQSPNPYLSQGGTRIQIGQFKVALSRIRGGLVWANTIYRIQ